MQNKELKKNSTKLLECPFCGGEADVEEHTGFSREKMYYVECRNNECPTMPSTEFCHSKEEAIKVWNTRKPMDRIVEQLEEEIEYCEKQVDKISATSFSIVNGLKRNIYIEKISAYRDAIEIVKEGGKDVTTRNDTGMD